MTSAQQTILFRSLILLLISTAWLPQVQAEQEVRYYDFEIIIFENLDPEAKLTEVWKRNLNREIPEVSVTLDQPYPGAMPKQFDPKFTFKYLPTDSLQLREEAKLLNEDEKYRVLLHTSWRQPGMDEESALPIHITRRFAEEKPDPFRNANRPDMPAVNLPQPVRQPVEIQSGLDGYIRIVLKRYLHANIDLVYTTTQPVAVTKEVTGEPVDEEATTSEVPVMLEPVFYRLQQTRKMRSKEVHYIDHPVLGVLLLATPFKPEP